MLKQLALGDLDFELAATRRMLERVPDEHFGWKPHEKSMSLGELASHLANLLDWNVHILRDDEIDLATLGAPPRAANRADLLQGFDEKKAALDAVAEAFDTATLGETWTLRNGEQVFFALPRAAVLRNFGISHMVHHRGQLSVYLRLLDVPLPRTYGPTADEKGM